ncbi:AAA family ATPase [uncultured Peptoniphilus sp.]|uniref:AAA family ATPase n=1 Tax=uncultured Peptoniphilus sp. TaxID=254354 RepID=UPI00280607FB|nr:AAA family ATPase [uncultured Peptoniphilus sp.]
MKYIKKVHLINFQSHADSILDFDEGLNVILGRSDSGKTAVIRAIKWALYNEPRGDYFVRIGEKDTSVEITFSDDTVLKRARNGNKNVYEFKNLLGEVTRYEGFGGEVPQEIIDQTAIFKDSIGQNSQILYIQDQLEGPFLLSLSPGQKAAEIGKLIGVDILDIAITNTRRDTLKLNGILREKKEEKEKLEKELEGFSFLEEDEKKLNRLIEIQKALSEKEDKLNKLSFLYDGLSKIKKSIEEQKAIIEKFKDLDNVKNIFEKLEHIGLKLNLLENAHSKLVKSKDDLEKNKKVIENLVNLDKSLEKYKESEEKFRNLQTFYRYYKEIKIFDERISNGNIYIKNFTDVERAKETYTKLDSLNRKLNMLEEIGINLKNLNNEILRINSQLKSIENEKENILAKYEEIYKKLDYCPFCYSKIGNESRRNILDHLRGEI